MAIYESEFQGATIDARLAAVATMQTAISNLETAVAAKYSKPANGIPETDLDASIQAALALARTAVQSLSDYYTKAQVDDIAAAIAASVDSTSGEVVATLPSAGAGTLGKMYYVGPDGSGFYDRYVTSYDGSTYSWLALGNTEVDMTQYATKDETTDIAAQLNGVRQPLAIQVNKGWMDSSAKVSLIDTTTHFVVPVKKGDRIAMKANANKSVYAFLTSYTAPTANGQSYSLCSGTSRVLTNASESRYITVPSDAVYMWVGIGDATGNNFPISLALNGVDLLNVAYSQKSDITIVEQTALPSATHIPTKNADFFLAYGKIRKGDRVLLKGNSNNASIGSSFTVQYAYYDVEPTIGMEASHLLAYGSVSSSTSAYFVSDYDGYFAAHFRPSMGGVAIENILDIITTRSMDVLSPGVKEEVKAQANIISYMVRSTMTDIARKRNTFNTPLFNCHRGVQAFGPENSLPAFLAGGTHGVWAIETDLRITSDDKIVCMHDASINRTMVNLDGSAISGTVNVSSKTLAELRANYKIAEVNSTTIPNKQYDYASFTAAELVIPTMDEYLGICQMYGIVPFIELKEDNGVIAAFIDAVKRYRLEGRCVVSSSSIDLLKAYRLAGGQEFVHLVDGSASEIDSALALGNSGIAFNITNFDADITGSYVYKNNNPSTPTELVQMCHALGLAVCFRAQDSKADAISAIEVGLDFMPTNNLWEKSQIE